MPLAPLSLIHPEDRRSTRGVDLPPSDYPLQLEFCPREEGSYWWKILAASFAVHIVLLSIATQLPTFGALRQLPRRPIVHTVPLYLPKDALTQKAPNTREVARHVDLAQLMDLQHQQAQQPSPNHSVRQFEMPKISNQPSTRAPVSILPDAPAVNTTQTAAVPVPGAANGLAIAPPPAPSSGPFQNIGSEAPVSAHPKLAPPKATVQSAIGGLAQSGSGSHVIIIDDSPTQGAPPVPGMTGQVGAQHAGVELKSDPEGMDMRPYLAQILSIVRGNWRRVIPMSARMGTMRGRTVIEFIINRDGSIPKLVTSEPSGLDPLDRAAVADVSMSNPLPPLPSDFKGAQVRLAFSFAYNMAAE